jgi:hypothetical protein
LFKIGKNGEGFMRKLALAYSLTLIPAIWEWLKMRSIEQGVTNKRVILKKGWG